jgi:flavin reductase (DIM6/NTAB) family NADH-FMN oxidoreductase RutF
LLLRDQRRILTEWSAIAIKNKGIMAKVIKASELEARQLYSFMTSAVIPRPIALVSTVNKEGVRNLSPFSYFNCVSTRPLMLMIAPVKQLKDASEKDTFVNLSDVPELTINMVTHAMGEQMSITSAAYEASIDEFIKSGFTPLPSHDVKPARVGESPVSFECRVQQIIELGQEGGAGNLVLCEILVIHVSDDILDGNGLIDPFKADFIARLGGNYYSRIIPESIFSISRGGRQIGVGFDAIPEAIRHSDILTGAELALLAGMPSIPQDEDWALFPDLWKELGSLKIYSRTYFLHRAKHLLAEKRVTEAWLVALQYVR